MVRVLEKEAFKVNGFVMLPVVLGLVGLGVWLFVTAIGPGSDTGRGGRLALGIALFVLGWILSGGLLTVQPNQARVLVFFGDYVGSVRDAGFWWTNPVTIKRAVSLRVRNFSSERLKVNDADGNPVEIAAVVVWRVVESAKAVFDVDDFEEFVDIQAETALRSLATRYPYDAAGQERSSLRENPDELAEALKAELDARLEVAGVDVLEARLTHLAYAPEIAQAMLRRQQAQAVVSARQLIVSAAVGMVEDAIKELERSGVVELDGDKRAAMASNLMVALTAEQAVTPVINAGTLYQGGEERRDDQEARGRAGRIAAGRRSCARPTGGRAAGDGAGGRLPDRPGRHRDRGGGAGARARRRGHHDQVARRAPRPRRRDGRAEDRPRRRRRELRPRGHDARCQRRPGRHVPRGRRQLHGRAGGPGVDSGGPVGRAPLRARQPAPRRLPGPGPSRPRARGAVRGRRDRAPGRGVGPRQRERQGRHHRGRSGGRHRHGARRGPEVRDRWAGHRHRAVGGRRRPDRPLRAARRGQLPARLRRRGHARGRGAHRRGVPRRGGRLRRGQGDDR